MNQYLIEFSALPWDKPAKGVRSKTVLTDGYRLRLLEFTKDFVEQDWCTKGHIGYILEGTLEVQFAQTSVRFNAGDALIIPQGPEHKHKATARSDVVRIFLVEDT